MLCFGFAGREPGGRTVTGRVYDFSLEEARSRLQARRIQVDVLRLELLESLRELLLPRGEPREMALFFRQLATMFRSGIGFSAALGSLARQPWSPSFALRVEDFSHHVHRGSTLSASLGRSREIPAHCLALVRTGEASGQLVACLERIADLLEADLRVRRRVQSALVYPAFLALVAALSVVAIGWFFLPRLAELVSGLNPQHQTLLGVFRLLGQPQVVFAGVELGLGLAVSVWLWSRSVSGRDVLARWLLRVQAVRSAALVRVCLAFSLMVKAGMRLDDILALLPEVAANAALGEALRACREAVRDGRPLSRALESQGVFRGPLPSLVRVGEETGRLADLLECTGTYYREDLDSRLEAATALLEPLAVAFLGFMIGTLALLMFLPLAEAVRSL